MRDVGFGPEIAVLVDDVGAPRAWGRVEDGVEEEGEGGFAAAGTAAYADCYYGLVLVCFFCKGSCGRGVLEVYFFRTVVGGVGTGSLGCHGNRKGHLFI